MLMFLQIIKIFIKLEGNKLSVGPVVRKDLIKALQIEVRSIFYKLKTKSVACVP